MIDVEKLTKSLKAATPEQFAKYVDQTIERLKKAADHLGKAASHIDKAIETHGKIGDAMDGLEEHHDAMAGHMAGMKDCMGKAVATGKLGKVTDEGDAKDMTTHMSGIEDAHGLMGKGHDDIQKLIDTQETHLDNAEGSIDDAIAAADEETDKGLAAAERTEKRHVREMGNLQKTLKRDSDRKFAAMQKANAAAQREVANGFNALVKALSGPPAPPAGVTAAVVPHRAAVTLDKAQDLGGLGKGAPAAVPGTPAAAQVSTGATIQATDEYGMPNPEYLKAVEAGQLGKDGGTAFVKAAGKVEAQVGNPFPDNGMNLSTEMRGPVN